MSHSTLWSPGRINATMRRCSASINSQSKIKYNLFTMPQSPQAPFLRDPITVPRKELIEHYRTQAARYNQLAERQRRSSIYEGLLSLARQCAAMADALESARIDQNTKPQLSEGDILLLLNRVIAEDKSASTSAAREGFQPASAAPALREPSLDEILQKIQRDIAEGKPAPASSQETVALDNSPRTGRRAHPDTENPRRVIA